METQMQVIARIRSAYGEKFGIPRQSGLVRGLSATIVFEPDYRNPDALRGLEAVSHLWLIWGFSQVRQKTWSPTVRPPRLGGNERVGVFATRSPYRPNPIGLSSVELSRIETDPVLGPVLHVLGADLMDGTPIYDIKPYIPYTDLHPDAVGGLGAQAPEPSLEVVLEEELEGLLSGEEALALRELLSYDPRPSYQDDPDRIYGMEFAGFEVKFSVAGTGLKVLDLIKL